MYMEYKCKCTYCGHEWNEANLHATKDLRCKICKDSNIQARKIDSRAFNPFGYETIYGDEAYENRD